MTSPKSRNFNIGFFLDFEHPIWKAVKVVMYESQFTVQADMFLTSSEAFKTVFYKLISIVSDVEDEVLKL